MIRQQGFGKRGGAPGRESAGSRRRADRDRLGGGCLAGRAEQGIDVRDASLIAGTSADAVVGAQIAAGLHPEKPLEAQLVYGERLAKPTAMGVIGLIWSLKRSKSPQEFGVRMGRIARTAVTPPEEEHIAEIGRRLGDVRGWPKNALSDPRRRRRLGRTGRLRRGKRVDLVHAVAAGTGPGIRPPVSISGRAYIDDPSRRAPAAMAGKAVGIRMAAEAAHVWNDPPYWNTTGQEMSHPGRGRGSGEARQMDHLPDLRRGEAIGM
ncbi:hypothetical protein FLW53_37035 [Microbispora sp. SCL1-1]|uniref:patatin-like phospholipase family protein n=1 Tax=Microbispora sp. CL1-1 TaxID=2720026 RepID=UPI0011686614|nr:patatin-like phospholipase family protein [Microbispora sp. CL1-1]NJP29699.1 hypothetical protein [Microbispora sp. CL1-1]TQS04403.1 hypothetical protein FLW53_37035 [Microbispora sp. SCL1-1]